MIPLSPDLYNLINFWRESLSAIYIAAASHDIEVNTFKRHRNESWNFLMGGKTRFHKFPDNINDANVLSSLRG